MPKKRGRPKQYHKDDWLPHLREYRRDYMKEWRRLMNVTERPYVPRINARKDKKKVK